MHQNKNDNLLLIFSRCAKLYFPEKIKEEEYFYRVILLIVGVWMLPFILFIPIWAESWGFIGLDCKTRICTIINMQGQSNSKGFLQEIFVALTFILLVVFDAAIYMRFKVRGSRLIEHITRVMI